MKKVWDLRNYKQPVHTVRCSSAINRYCSVMFYVYFVFTDYFCLRFSMSPISSTIALPMDDRRTKLCDITGNRLGNLRSHDKGVIKIGYGK